MGFCTFVCMSESLDLRNYRRQCQYVFCCYHERMAVNPLISHHGGSIVIKEESLYVFMSVIGYRNMQFSPCLVTADSDCAIQLFARGALWVPKYRYFRFPQLPKF